MSKEKTFQEKFKQFFKQTINKGIPKPQRSDEFVILTDEIEAELREEAPIGVRLKAIKEFTEISKRHPFEAYMLEKLWILLNDLLRPDVPKETRHLVFNLFVSICGRQVDKSGSLRASLFNFIRAHSVVEDAGPRFEFLRALTENGKDVSYFDEKIGPFILAWMAQLVAGGGFGLIATSPAGSHPLNQGELGPGLPTSAFMSLLVNLIKFNQSFLDHDIIVGIIQNVCLICCCCSTKEDAVECLNVLSALICYSSVPPGCLSTFLATLCRTVNVETLSQSSWKILRNLLGTHLGHSGLLTMCGFMENLRAPSDLAIVRGSIFFVGVALWGPRPVRTLRYNPTTVLSSFSTALDSPHPFLTFEVCMRLQDLVRNRADTLHSAAWDYVIEILEKIVHYRSSHLGGGEDLTKITTALNETLDGIEGIVNTGVFVGSTDKFYTLIDSCAQFRPEPSVERLLEYKVRQRLGPINPAWLGNLIEFVEQHYKLESRPNIRSKALQKMTRVALLNMDTHEEEIIDRIIIPYLKGLDMEVDTSVRQDGVHFLVKFLLSSTSRKAHDLLYILERIISRPFEQSVPGDTVHIFSENEIIDVRVAVKGLIRIFERKIYHLPSSIAVQTYKILVRHLDKHYKRPTVLEQIYTIRYDIFECYFRIRANSLYHLGFPKEGFNPDGSSKGQQIIYSPYLAVDHREGDEVGPTSSPGVVQHIQPPQGDDSNTPHGHGLSVSSPHLPTTTSTSPNVTYISLTAACKLVVCSMKKEKDWRVLKLVLQQLPKVLENKALILSKHGNDIDYLAHALTALVMEKKLNLPNSCSHLPKDFKQSEFQSFLFPILTALVSYHSHLDRENRVNIIKCLKFGLVSSCSQICITSLSMCTLEMKDTMHKLLPEVLLSLSKISPKVNIAIPVLEFLSTLIHLPRVFASLLQDQYMSIFAIALPYTNPFKFNQYTVSLSHHVIAMWFLKCRLSYRRGFVSFIMKGLESNVLAPFEQEQRKNNAGGGPGDPRNEDSSNRKRSSSLTDNNRDKGRMRSISGAQISTGSKFLEMRSSQLDMKNLMSFHEELTETCVDLMARYAFADCSALPTRFNSTNFLLSGGGVATSWILDNKIITITTSGCTQKELRSGLCDKCWLLCRKVAMIRNGGGGEEDGGEESGGGGGVPPLSPEKGGKNIVDGRRRHRSAFAGSPGKKSADSVLQEDSLRLSATDDILIHQHSKDMDELGELVPSGVTSTAPTFSQTLDFTPKIKGEHLCTCWCQGWAEIHIRRPTGNTSWMMRVQNEIGNFPQGVGNELPLKELSSMFVQGLGGTGNPGSPTPKGTDSPMSPKSPGSPTGDPTDPIEIERREKNLVRRSLSSPEMGVNWKSPFSCQETNIEEEGEEDGVGGGVHQGDGKNPTGEGARLSKKPPQTLENPITLGSVHPAPPSPCRRSYDAIPEEMSASATTLIHGSPCDFGPMSRDRTATISVMSPAQKNPPTPTLRRNFSTGAADARERFRDPKGGGGNPWNNESGIRSGISPSFVFLQLCSQGFLGQNINSRPILIPSSHDNSLKVLDYIPPYETHKIGVLYVGQKTDEASILQNQFGSLRYRDFLQGLGALIKLRDVDPQKMYIGGLSRDGSDGEYAYIWLDDVMQVIFHVATLMPNNPTDPCGNAKKRHIGNDYVAIVYNNSDEEYDISTLKGQFLYACVVIQPLDHKTNRVIVKAKPHLTNHIGHGEAKIVSDQNLPILARQLALHSNLASVIFQSIQREQSPYASNWLERLRAIKRLKARLQEQPGQTPGADLHALNSSSGGNSGGGGGGGFEALKRNFNFEDFTQFV